MTVWQVTPTAAPGDVPLVTPSGGALLAGIAITIGAVGTIVVIAGAIRRLAGPAAKPYLVIGGTLAAVATATLSALVAGTTDEPGWIVLAVVVTGAISGGLVNQVDAIVARIEERTQTIQHYGAYLDALDAQTQATPSAWRSPDPEFDFTALNQPATVVVHDRHADEANSMGRYDPRRATGPRINAADALDDPTTPHILVLGDPGYGKSWLLRATAARHIVIARAAVPRRGHRHAHSALKAVDLPIRVDLTRLVPALTSDLDAALVTVLGGPRSTAYRAWLADRLATGPCLLLIDGLDEIRADDLRPLREALRTWIDTHPSSRIVLTSRPIEHARGILPTSRRGRRWPAPHAAGSPRPGHSR